MSTGLFVLRVVVGLLLAGHGAQKLFGKFGGYGLEGTGGWFHSIGFRPGARMAFVAGLSELVGGLLLALGLLTPLAAAAVIGTMTVAASTHLPKGLWGQNGGYEQPLTYAVVAAALAFTGPGDASVDNLLGIEDWSGVATGIVAIAVGLLSALVVISQARRALASDTAAYPTEPAEGRTSADVSP
jgi:putative oxidoreductase